MTTDQISALFTRSDGSFLCARWGRPVAPVIFGLADESLDIFRAAIRAGYAHAGHAIAETDPESGANLLVFVCRDWDELDGIPDLDLLTGLDDLPARLAGRDHYQMMRFDKSGAIRACLSFLRVGGAFADTHPAQLAEMVAMRSTLSFAAQVTPSAELALLIRAAYAPVLPSLATDPAHAYRLAARLGVA
ncbi:MAG: hypothetical protein Q4G36_09665 [Paracoccus sp. (in: a-proteobacteria)]|nr:hypothetical protein [Paracoccus sp. (in: a-proteobacteria)]